MIFFLLNIFPELKFHRLEIAIEAGWEKGIKWASKLGFTAESICEAYDHHYTDHIIFTRVVR